MFRISDRLLALAQYIDPGEAVADIGTDHGFLPIFLYRNGISHKVILSDVKKGPLEKAKENLKAYAPFLQADLRLGSGLEPYGPSCVDSVVIAGMGGRLIIDILAHDLKKTASFGKFILQPRNAQDKLRRWLYSQGFLITGEQLVRERHHICEIIAARPPSKDSPGNRPDENELERMEKDLVFLVSPLLFERKDPLLAEFLRRKIRTEESIRNAILENGSGSGLEQAERSQKRMERLSFMLAQIEEEI